MLAPHAFLVNPGEALVNALARVATPYVVSNERDAIIGECSSGLAGRPSNDRGFRPSITRAERRKASMPAADRGQSM